MNLSPSRQYPRSFMNDWTRISDGKVHHRGRFHGENNERAKHRRGNEGNMKATLDRAFIYIFHNSREPREFGEKEIVTSIVFKWPVKSRSLVGLMLPFFHSTRRSGISPLSTLFFERARSRQSLATDQETFEAATIQPRYSNDLKDVLSPTLSSFHPPLSSSPFYQRSFSSPHFFFFSLPSFFPAAPSTMDFKSHFIGNLRPDSG